MSEPHEQLQAIRKAMESCVFPMPTPPTNTAQSARVLDEPCARLALAEGSARAVAARAGAITRENIEDSVLRVERAADLVADVY